MNNTDKLLRAFIEAQGFEVKEVKTPVTSLKQATGALTIAAGGVYSIDYKVTKKKAQACFDIDSPEWSCIVDFVLSHRGDIESGINDFDCLKPMHDYFNGVR